MLQGIKILKLYCWEDPYQARLEGMRVNEIATVRKLNVGARRGVHWVRVPCPHPRPRHVCVI